jgi:hypothetical protein
MASFYKYDPLETLALQSRPSELDWWAWIPDPKINGQIKLEGGTRFAESVPIDPPRIRLIRLKRGNESDPIEIELDIHGLLDAPEYDALSYAWGNPEKTHQIDCNGLIMQVNQNVHTALKRLRAMDNSRALWIDALCIDQENNDEKSSQVKLMGEIYARACSVPIWLGDEADSDVHAFQVVEAIYKRLSQRTVSGSKEKLTVDEINGLDDFPNNGWKQLSSLLSRPWFTRLWVLQEAAKAQNPVLLVGTQSIPYKQLEEVVSQLPHHATMDLVSLTNVLPPMLIRSCRKGNTYTIFDLMWTTNPLETSEPRDRIYSLLNLPLFEMEWVPLPDYTLSPMEVFRDFTLLDLVHNGSFRAISWAYLDEAGEVADSSFPSWVPDFTRRHLPVFSFFSYGRNLRAGGTLEIAAKVHDKSVLTLQGRKASQIVQIGRSRKDHYGRASVRQPQVPSEFGRMEQAVERAWIDECHGMFTHVFGSRFPSFKEKMFSNLYKDFIRALCCDWDPVFQGPPIEAVVVRLRMAIWHLKAMEDGLPMDEEWDQDELYRRRLTHGQTWGARFCILENGSMGWVPSGATNGDVIFVFNGAVVPYVLRPQTDGTYLWVGESWISGVMNGEILGLEVEPELVNIG